MKIKLTTPTGTQTITTGAQASAGQKVGQYNGKKTASSRYGRWQDARHKG